MTELTTLLAAPPSGTINHDWFTTIADALLNHTVFMVGERRHRLLEIEFYYNGDTHADPFAHSDPMQQSCARWYFHRDEGTYRGGSFKGLDISFGPEGMFGGILIRTIAALDDGTIINGCSLSVDHMLATTGTSTVAELDGIVDGRSVVQTDSPLHLVADDTLDSTQVWATGRVGLTLKRMYANPTMPEFIMKPYRFLIDPTIKKGKVHTVIALHVAGLEPDAIKAATGSPQHIIKRYIEAYNEGQAEGELKRYRGKKLKTQDLCIMHGIWQRQFNV
ncbi:MAG: hypothetical protein AAFX99_34030 [Myxococcota bacterium]